MKTKQGKTVLIKNKEVMLYFEVENHGYNGELDYIRYNLGLLKDNSISFKCSVIEIQESVVYISVKTNNKEIIVKHLHPLVDVYQAFLSC